jgi:hypothetical protein
MVLVQLVNSQVVHPSKPYKTGTRLNWIWNRRGITCTEHHNLCMATAFRKKGLLLPCRQSARRQ